jgi:5-methylcytosine-specific restriction protein A
MSYRPRLKAPGFRVPTPKPRVASPVSDGGKNAAHYHSPEHRAWAAAVKARDGYRCVRCGAAGPGVRLIADHKIEIEDGGARFDLNNGVTLCLACHNRKTAKERATRGGMARLGR